MDLHKKVIGNAVVSYFLLFVSLTFLWSKQPYLNHPFVKSHVKVAFILHLLLIGTISIMSLSFGESFSLLGYSLNTIITIVLLLAILSGILYGAYIAHLGKTITLGEMLSRAGAGKILQSTHTKNLTEEHIFILILAHIPFIGYIVATRNTNLSHIRDISMINMMCMCLALIVALFGALSFSSIILLAYAIFSVFQSLRLIFTKELHSIDTSIIPTPREKIILQKSLLQYLGNTLSKKNFVPLKELIGENTQKREKQEQILEEKLQKVKASPLPTYIFYIPFINFIGIFFRNTNARIHIQNGILLSLLLLFILFYGNTPLFLLLCIPLFYGIGNTEKSAYLMPYIYDTWHMLGNIFAKVFRLGKKTRELHKTDTVVTVKMGEEKESSKA